MHSRFRRHARWRHALLLVVVLALGGPSVYNWLRGPFAFDPSAYQADPAHWLQHRFYVQVRGNLGRRVATLTLADRKKESPFIVRRWNTDYALLRTGPPPAGYTLFCTLPRDSGTMPPASAEEGVFTGLLHAENPALERALGAGGAPPDAGTLHAELHVEESPATVSVAALVLAVLCLVGWGRTWIRPPAVDPTTSESVLLVLPAPWRGAFSQATLVLLLGLGATWAVGRGTWAAVAVASTLALAALVVWQSRRDRYVLTADHLVVDTSDLSTWCPLAGIARVGAEGALDGSTTTLAIDLTRGPRIILDVTGCTGVTPFVERLAELAPQAAICLDPCSPPRPGGAAFLGTFNRRLGACLLLVPLLVVAAEWGAARHVTHHPQSFRFLPSPELGYVPGGDTRPSLDDMVKECSVPGRHVLVVGTTVGEGPPRVATSQVVCQLLQERWTAEAPGPPLTVVDACVDGYGLAKSVRLAGLLAERCRPRAIVVLAFQQAHIEVLKSIEPHLTSRDHFQQALLRSALGQCLLVALYPTPHQGERTMADADSAPPERAPLENLGVLARELPGRGYPTLIVNWFAPRYPAPWVPAITQAQQDLHLESVTVPPTLVTEQAARGADASSWIVEAVGTRVLKAGWLTTSPATPPAAPPPGAGEISPAGGVRR